MVSTTTATTTFWVEVKGHDLHHVSQFLETFSSQRAETFAHCHDFNIWIPQVDAGRLMDAASFPNEKMAPSTFVTAVTKYSETLARERDLQAVYLELRSMTLIFYVNPLYLLNLYATKRNAGKKGASRMPKPRGDPLNKDVFEPFYKHVFQQAGIDLPEGLISSLITIQPDLQVMCDKKKTSSKTPLNTSPNSIVYFLPTHGTEYVCPFKLVYSKIMALAGPSESKGPIKQPYWTTVNHAGPIFHPEGQYVAETAFNNTSAGIDLFSLFDSHGELIKFSKLPGKEARKNYRRRCYTFSGKIQVGPQICIPPDHFGLITSRSSAYKSGYKIINGIIDTGYTGPLLVQYEKDCFFANKPTAEELERASCNLKDQSFAQLILIPCPKLTGTVDIYTNHEDWQQAQNQTLRGAQGFGSTQPIITIGSPDSTSDTLSTSGSSSSSWSMNNTELAELAQSLDTLIQAAGQPL